LKLGHGAAKVRNEGSRRNHPSYIIRSANPRAAPGQDEKGQPPAQPGGNLPAKANEKDIFRLKLTVFCPAFCNL
jgi:hypothetical protein